MPFQLQISTGSPVPIYRQIIDQICHAVALGAVEPGEQLPSVRTLAEQLVINPNTVARTYSQLIREGVLEAQKGRGVFVTRRRAVYTEAERLRRLQQPLDAFMNEALLLGLSPLDIRQLVEERLKRLEATPAPDGHGSDQHHSGGHNHD